MGGFLYALAGGAYAAGDAYSKQQKELRTYELQQKGADAELIRKQNFARFGIDIDKQKAQNRSDIALEQFKGQQEVTQGYSSSGFVDPATGQPLTKDEVKKRGGITGLVPIEDWKADKETKSGIKSAKARKDATLEEAAKTYGKDSQEYKDIQKKLFGLSTSTAGEWTVKDKVKSYGDLKKNILKRKDKYTEGGMLGQTAAEAVAITEELYAAVEPIGKKYGAENATKVKKATKMVEIASQLEGKSVYEAEKYLKEKYKGMPQKYIDAILEIANYKGQTGDNSWLETAVSAKDKIMDSIFGE
jgi:hypothetical protein